jgi:hypothetical protein
MRLNIPPVYYTLHTTIHCTTHYIIHYTLHYTLHYTTLYYTLYTVIHNHRMHMHIHHIEPLRVYMCEGHASGQQAQPE